MIEVTPFPLTVFVGDLLIFVITPTPTSSKVNDIRPGTDPINERIKSQLVAKHGQDFKSKVHWADIGSFGLWWKSDTNINAEIQEDDHHREVKKYFQAFIICSGINMVDIHATHVVCK